MTKTEAIELLREYAECQRAIWSGSPEGQKHMSRFNEAVATLAATCEKPDTDLADDVTKAMRRAWFLGQEYWRLDDSESRSDHRKADETEKEFEELMKETRDLVLIRSDAMKGEQ